MRKFSIQTLGCKVNHYESEQMATLLRARGWVQTEPSEAELRIVHTCSVTTEAASKSRQIVRRSTRLPELGKTVVTGCWATSNPDEAKSIAGVDSVITHHQSIAEKLEKLIEEASRRQADEGASTLPRMTQDVGGSYPLPPGEGRVRETLPNSQVRRDIETVALTPALSRRERGKEGSPGINIRPRSLPLLDARQAGHQRAFLKIQDGCDAHCTYCIIPTLRPALSSKPIADAVDEARRMVDAGHGEIVLTGIFLSAFGQNTALRRRQAAQGRRPLADLIRALCTQVPGLHRLRLSSLEPGDLDEGLIAELTSHPQIMPHFHLPLQSGSDEILRRMNRQYRRDDFLRMIDRVRDSFDRPALTTDIIVGFPGEGDDDFEQTVQIAQRARFIHIHAFPFSARPGTAAARWTGDFVRGPVVGQRIDYLEELAKESSLDFRRGFVGQDVQIAVERDSRPVNPVRHGRCERYFDVEFPADDSIKTGDLVTVRVEQVAGEKTLGRAIESTCPA